MHGRAVGSIRIEAGQAGIAGRSARGGERLRRPVGRVKPIPMSSTASDNKEFVRRWHADVWNDGNIDRIDEFVADDFVEHSSAHPEKRGPSGVREDIEQLRAAFPDLSVTEEDTVAEGDKVVSRLTFSGTHDDRFQGIEPTGNEVAFGAIAINRVEDGRLVESWVQVDVMGLMHQLGAVDSPGE